MEELTPPRRYIILRVMDKKELDVGDIIKLFHADREETFLGRVVQFDDTFVLLNNSEEFFIRTEWECAILYSDKGS